MNKQNSARSQTSVGWWAYLGPGIITAALVFGPGSLTITSKLGAIYEFQMLWVVILATVLMMAFTSMGARIGIATDHSLLQVIKKRWGAWASLLAGIGIFLVSVSFQAGNSVAAGVAFAEPLGTSATPWIILVVVCGIALLFFKSFYRILEKVMIIMVGIMLVSFLLTLIITRPDWSSVAGGVIPSLPAGSLLLVVALVASSFSMTGAFYQSYLVQEKGWKAGEARRGIKESITGIFILGCISGMILMGSGAILHPQGIEVNAASDMGLALQPLYGTWATSLFMLGLFGASFSSLIGNATIGGTLLADALSLGSNLSSRPVRICISLLMIAGAVIAVLFGKLPLELIVFAQGVTIFIVPFIGVAIFVIANDKEKLGSLANGWLSNFLGIIGLLVLFGLAIANINNLFL